MTRDLDLLDRLERYYDAVPRARSRVEQIGPFTLFIAESGWQFYARPRLGETAQATPDDVRRVLERQRELDLPQSIEWVDEITPGLVDTVRAAGADVELCPLLVLVETPRGSVGTARMAEAKDEDVVRISQAAIAVGFANGGTSTGAAGVEERDTALAAGPAELDQALRERLRSGQLRVAMVFAPDRPELGPVGGGSYSAVNDVAEIAGVAVLPAFRRQALGAQLTFLLATDALSHGVATVFCSAQSNDVARIYESVGFRRVATACIAQAHLQ